MQSYLHYMQFFCAAANSIVFATVRESSINPWDSWFIFDLRKNKQLLLHNIFVHGKEQKERVAVMRKFTHKLAM